MSFKGTTVITHDKEEGNFSNHTDVEVPINYNIEMDKIVALIEASHKCRQFISMETFNTRINAIEIGKKWMSRHGFWRWNWAIPSGSNGCPCSLKKGSLQFIGWVQIKL